MRDRFRFRLIAPEPLAFLVWVALYRVVGIVPQMPQGERA